MTKKEILKQLKDERSFIKNQFLTPQNIRDYLYIIRDPLKENVSYFENSYNLVSGNFRDNIVFLYPNKQKDYLVFSRNSSSSLPQQIYIGCERGGQIYFMGEAFPVSKGSLSLIIAPDSSYFDHKVKGFFPKLERSSISKNSKPEQITVENLMCVSYASEARDRIGMELKRAIDLRNNR